MMDGHVARWMTIGRQSRQGGHTGQMAARFDADGGGDDDGMLLGEPESAYDRCVLMLVERVAALEAALSEFESGGADATVRVAVPGGESLDDFVRGLAARAGEAAAAALPHGCVESVVVEVRDEDLQMMKLLSLIHI